MALYATRCNLFNMRMFLSERVEYQRDTDNLNTLSSSDIIVSVGIETYLFFLTFHL